ERGHPVDRLRYAWHLVEIRGSQLLRHRGHALGELRRRFRNTLAHDCQFLLERRIVDPLIQASPLQRVVHLARGGRRENDQRWVGGPDRSDLRNRDLEFRQELEKKSLELL